jgi:methanogenic corrinoid protein MtbC1
MKKTVYTLSVDNYRTDVTSITFPAMQAWADKIGADFHIISDFFNCPFRIFN